MAIKKSKYAMKKGSPNRMYGLTTKTHSIKSDHIGKVKAFVQRARGTYNYYVDTRSV